MLALLQKIGRSLLLPIAVMPIAALLFRLGAPDLLDIPFVMAAGAAIMDNLAILFAIGIAIGMAVDQRGEAVLAVVVGYFVMIGTLTGLLVQTGYGADQEIVTRLTSNVLLGLIIALLSVWTYNRFYQTNLPTLFRFFSGRRLVPILTAIFGLLLGLILFVIWPLLWQGLGWFNEVIFGWGLFGTAVFGFLNRLLLPFGLHHVLNTYFWFSLGDFVNPATGQLVTGDIPRFLNGDPTAGVYQVGFYPIMMGGLLGAALAFMLASRADQRKRIAGLVGSAALVSLVTGITEPLEYVFLFVAPWLYGLHALLTAVAHFVANSMGLRHGFAFSAGLIDYLLNYGLAERPNDLAILTVVFFLAYFLIFYLVIRIFNLKTIGREEQSRRSSRIDELIDAASEKDNGEVIHTRAILAALGGTENVTAVSRNGEGLQITVLDSSLAIESALITLGADTIVKPSSTSLLLTFNGDEELIAAEMARLLLDEDAELKSDVVRASTEPATVADPFTEARVRMFIDGLGYDENITGVESIAATRLRVTVVDPLLVDEEALRAAGASGIMHTAESIHVLVGVKAPQYAAEMKRQLQEA
jgi:PTS system N-acetylglucosamine-specific IIC component